MARREARLENDSIASFPHAPYDSTTRGIHNQPNSLHFTSLASCFLSSVACAAAPAVTPASDIMFEFSGEVTDMSQAAVFPRAQLETRTSAGREWLWSGVRLQPASTCTLKWARLHVSANMSLNLLWRNTTSPPRLQVVAWCPRGSNILSGQSAQTEPSAVSSPNHHFSAVWNTGGSKCKPWPSDGITVSHEEACGEDADKRRALSAIDREPWRTLNKLSSKILERVFWEGNFSSTDPICMLLLKLWLCRLASGERL